MWTLPTCMSEAHFLELGLYRRRYWFSSILRWCDVCLFCTDMYTDLTCMPQMAILALGYVRK